MLHKTPVSCQLTRVFLLSLQPADLASKHGGSKASRHLADVAARFRAFRMPSCAACAGLRSRAAVRRRAAVAEEPLRGLAPQTMATLLRRRAWKTSDTMPSFLQTSDMKRLCA